MYYITIIRPRCLSSSQSLASQSALLSRVDSELLVLLGLLDNVLLLGDDQLNVRGRRLVGVDSTVSSVSSSSHLGGLVDLDVGDDQLGGVQALGLSVGLSVDQEVLDETHRLLGPSTEGGTVLLGLASSADGRVESSEGDDIVVGQNSLEVSEGLVNVLTVDSLGGLSGVLERDTEVVTLGLHQLSGVGGSSSVSSHGYLEKIFALKKLVNIFRATGGE